MAYRVFRDLPWIAATFERRSRPRWHAVAAVIGFVFLAAACGADADLGGQAGDSAEAEAPVPVEPDGGTGGALPLLGSVASGGQDWHGRQVPETNCPMLEWDRFDASAFSFSVPGEFVETPIEGIDSEVGEWMIEGIEVGFDYGRYSWPLDQEQQGAEITAVNFDGRLGNLVVAPPDDETSRSLVGIYFPQVVADGDLWNALSVWVFHERSDDEVIGRCIVESIEWTGDNS